MLFRSLFHALTSFRTQAASAERDDEILGVLEQAQLFLMGSCGYALRFARQAGVDLAVQVLERSMRQIGSFALYLTSAHPAFNDEYQRTESVA